MNILIKRNSSTVLTVQVPLSSSDYSRTLMGEELVTLAWDQANYTELKVGDYITYDGQKFSLNKLPDVKKISSNHYEYNAVFQSQIYDLLKVGYLLFDSTDTIPSGEFSLTGTPATFVQLLVDNLNRVYGSAIWSVGTVLDSEAVSLSFSNENCFNILARLADEFDTEYSVSNYQINLIEITGTSNLELEYGSTLYDIERKSLDSSDIITRLYPFGSTKNIASTYRSGSTRLLLPSFQQYIEANTDLYGIIEGQQTFESVYPRLGSTDAGTVTSIGSDIYTFSDDELDFNLNNYLQPGTSAKLRFLTGECAGYDLEIYSFTDATKTYRVIANEDDKGYKVPNASIYPAVGDKYVLLDVIMPDSYLSAAEAELLAEAQDYLNENSQPKVSYSVTFSAIWAKLNAPDIKPGDLVSVVDTDLGIDTDLRVTKVTKGITDSENIKVDLSNTVSKSTLARIADEIASNTRGVTKTESGLTQQFARNWRNVEELSTMIDTLRTDMLFVGNVQGQFDIVSTLFTPNYQNDKNKFYATAGSLVHKTIPSDDAPGTWTIPAYAPTLAADATPYYLYAKCNRANSTGVYHISASAIVYDSDPTYYYFLVGVISSVVSGVRTLQTTYGFTQITGKQLVTGNIQSADASTYFNLDTGEIGGNIKFKSGATYKEVGAGITEAVDAVEIGGVNLISESLFNVDISAYGYGSRYVDVEAGKIYTLSVNGNSANAQNGHYLRVYIANSGWTFSKVISITETVDTTKSISFTAASSETLVLSSYYYPNTEPRDGSVRLNWVQLEKGSKATDWSKSQLDVENGYKTYTDVEITNVEIGGRNYLRSETQTEGWSGNGTDYGSIYYFSSNIRLTTNGTNYAYGMFRALSSVLTETSMNGKTVTLSFDAYSNGTAAPITVYSDKNSGTKLITTLTSSWKRYSLVIPAFVVTSANLLITNTGYNLFYYFKNFKLEVGNKASDYSKCPEEVEELAQAASDNADTAITKATALDYLKAAIAGTTEIEGGLALANIFGVKDQDGTTRAGMNGIDTAGTDIIFWAGSTIENMATAPFRVYENGDVAIGNEKDGYSLVIERDQIATLASLVGALSFSDVGGTETRVNPDYGSVSVPIASGTYSDKYECAFSLDKYSELSFEVRNHVEYQSYNSYSTFGTRTQTTKIINEDTSETVWEDTASPVYSHVFTEPNQYNDKYKKDKVLTIYLPKGNYRIVVEAALQTAYYNSYSTTIVYYTYVDLLQYRAVPNKGIYGTNGFALFADQNKYIYASLIANYLFEIKGKVLLQSPNGNNKLDLTDNNLKIEGKVDIPGGLGGASISSGGSFVSGSNWGLITSSAQIAKSGSSYTITHNIGNTEYSIVLTPISSYMPFYASKQANSIVAVCNGGFDFVLIRTK